jgi:translation initiation factor IF-2
MGHVDHGKSSLLDYIRKTNTTGKEAGGITQAVGAYEIEHRTSNTEQARRITFIDTPGHEAFTKMRHAGAHVADLAILVVAADEGVKPQTKEAVEILRTTETPFLVAVTKIDKGGADIERVKKELAEAGVLLEGYGGNISYHGVSSKTGEGVSELLDLLVLAAELQGLTYDPSASATGFVLEATLDSRRGPQATVILENGTLREAAWIATPSAEGRIRVLENFRKERVSALLPSAPARVVGFRALPAVGETFVTGEDEEALGRERSKLKALHPKLQREKASSVPQTTEQLVKLILKADDAGSLAALSLTLRNMEMKDKLYIVEEAVGDITDGDVKLAHAAGAAIIGFKSRVAAAAQKLADSQAVAIITSEIIYELVKAVETFLTQPAEVATLGELEVLALFNQAKLRKQLVGGKVVGGTLKVGAGFEIRRGEEVVGRGKILRMKEKKTELTQATVNAECGILADASVAIAVGDRIIIKR